MQEVFADAGWASKAVDKRSVSGRGGGVMYGGACASWFSITQKSVTLSTTEEKHVSVADLVQEVIFLRQVWQFMVLVTDVGMSCIPVFKGKEGAVQLA